MFNIMNLILIFLTALHLLQEGYGLNKLEERFRWVHINFNFENESARQKALESRQFIPENNIPFGVEVWKNKVFITIPRRSPGVPATLNYFDLDRKESTPLLIPYPDWHSNEPLVDHITSTYRTNADTCDRLWTFDTGSVTGSDGTVNRIQAPRILIFNLNTNTLIKSHHLNSTKFICFPLFINIVPDIRGSCDDAYAYAINPDSSDLLVYSVKDDKSWIKTHSYFFPHPFQMDYKIGELRFQWDDGLFGFALSELDKNGNRKAYLHPMSGLYEFTVDTKLLRDPNAKLLQDQVKIIATRNATYQASATAFDEKSGVLFYSLVSKNGIGCWNTRKSPNMGPNMDIVAADDQTMVYSSDVKVDKNGNLWTISNRLPIILYGNNDEAKSKNVKYRVFTAPIKQLIKNTKCDTN